MVAVFVKNGETAVMLASVQYQEGCLRLLIDAGANLDQTDAVRESNSVCECDFGRSVSPRLNLIQAATCY